MKLIPLITTPIENCSHVVFVANLPNHPQLSSGRKRLAGQSLGRPMTSIVLPGWRTTNYYYIFESTGMMGQYSRSCFRSVEKCGSIFRTKNGWNFVTQYATKFYINTFIYIFLYIYVECRMYCE